MRARTAFDSAEGLHEPVAQVFVEEAERLLTGVLRHEAITLPRRIEGERDEAPNRPLRTRDRRVCERSVGQGSKPSLVKVLRRRAENRGQGARGHRWTGGE